MKIRNSLKSLKGRHRDCRVIRRRGRTYVINKTNRRFKARQGYTARHPARGGCLADRPGSFREFGPFAFGVR